MEKSKVFFTDLRTSPGNDMLTKLEKLVRRAGISEIDFEGKFAAIKIHFGEPGNLAYIRPNCHIGDKVKVGDFVEVKNSNIGNGTKIPHLAYIGDTDAGEKINFGCGSIMVNYDGKKKHRTVVEDGVFVGCNANLVAPVTVKKGSYIAAGSTITKDVPEEVLAVARARQTVIEGWIEKRK